MLFSVRARGGARVRQLAVCLQGNRLEWARIDDVKQVAGMHDSAVAKLERGDKDADAGADLHLLDRLEPTGELVPIGDGAFHRLRHRDRGRRRRGLLRRLVAAAG